MERAFITLGTPDWGDNKKGDGSWLDVHVTLFTTQGIIQGGCLILDGSPVNHGETLGREVGFPNQQNISFESIQSVALEINYKRDHMTPSNTDDWDARAEVVLVWPEGTLASGSPMEAKHLSFADHYQPWAVFHINRADMLSAPTLKPPVH